MIYADTSFLFSFYAYDDNTAAASRAYREDGRRPLLFTPWQRFELRNSVRLSECILKRSAQDVPFRRGNVYRQIDSDLAGGILRHVEPDWLDTFREAERLSAIHTERLGSAAVDLWHVASAIVLRADTFWTFDGDQFGLAKAVGKFSVPLLKS